ncbi:DUF1127 domain-containing protein [Cereibacter sphaeroides]|uniref:DUF1127 domain-containing protein n=1 Tax=Cereibacter sphaeroides TaxID=1063 RepID=UPI001F23FB9D|nr:DUF1127 domain-containing protein [Cereibacter sphaeroides]MCE6958750.1 DUF1127 domain-containing protein [Cereibacter sphaeroides]MCE6973376.1 DUF1127 domain-containing protein [Cereibacter sphaeroides]
MTTLSASRPAHAPFAGLLKALGLDETSRRQRRIYRDTCTELGMLSDAELDDIGINRFDIREIARAHAQRAA